MASKEIVRNVETDCEGLHIHGAEVEVDEIDDEGKILGTTFYAVTILKGRFYAIHESPRPSLDMLTDIFDTEISLYDDDVEEEAELRKLTEGQKGERAYWLAYASLKGTESPRLLKQLADLPKDLDELDVRPIGEEEA